MDILTISHLAKRFGSHEVLKDVSLNVPEHSIYGFIGQNGSGKTTTMKIILGLLDKDRGNITVCQEEANYGQTKTNRFIGYLPDVPEYYNFMNPYEYLQLCGRITGMEQKEIAAGSKELLSLVGLEPAAKKRIGGFSRGMKQRLGIAQALLNQPQLLICDEPTSALDPVGRKEILDILNTVKEKTTVLFSTHILADVERICDHIAILHDGTIAINGALNEIKEKHGTDSLRVEFGTAEECARFEQIYQMNCGGAVIEVIDSRTITISAPKIEKTQSELFGILIQNKLMPLSVLRKEPSLENIFLEVVK